ncbi:MAG: hypothetical protein HYR85_04490 [Planctomycetes bacterium]|nr:hypothetical protein [Planctomycetota bacterium]MBI3844096.1 hypothetical protein [Planctomycetota bacterium]
MTTARLWTRVLCAGAGAIVVSSVRASAQPRALVISTSGDAATAQLPDIDDEELLVLTPGSGRPIGSFLSDLSWRAVLGDANGNGNFDDEPAEVDAIAFPPGLRGRPTIYDAYVSFGSTQHFTSGEEALDGDVVRLRPDGTIETIVPEAAIAAATGTTTIDVDALAIDESGAIFFSFSENELTTDAALIAQNGSATLDDGDVFRLDAGAVSAALVYREADFIAMVSNALGRTVSSIVDVTEVEMDPDHPGQLFFVVGSTASGLEGTVFTTANGGAVASLNGVPLTGSSIGFVSEESLDGLAIVNDFGTPLALEADNPQVSLSAASEVTVRVLNGTPGGRVRVLASPPRTPYLPPQVATSGGIGWLYVDTSSALYQRSSTRVRFLVNLDSAGTGSFTYPTGRTPAGISRVLQPMDDQTGELGDAIVLETIP